MCQCHCHRISFLAALLRFVPLRLGVGRGAAALVYKVVMRRAVWRFQSHMRAVFRVVLSFTVMLHFGRFLALHTGFERFKLEIAGAKDIITGLSFTCAD